jgi:hypothetical protein
MDCPETRPSCFVPFPLTSVFGRVCGDPQGGAGPEELSERNGWPPQPPRLLRHGHVVIEDRPRHDASGFGGIQFLMPISGSSAFLPSNLTEGPAGCLSQCRLRGQHAGGGLIRSGSTRLREGDIVKGRAQESLPGAIFFFSRDVVISFQWRNQLRKSGMAMPFFAKKTKRTRLAPCLNYLTDGLLTYALNPQRGQFHTTLPS